MKRVDNRSFHFWHQPLCDAGILPPNGRQRASCVDQVFGGWQAVVEGVGLTR